LRTEQLCEPPARDNSNIPSLRPSARRRDHAAWAHSDVRAAGPTDIAVENLATGLDTPWAVDFAPDGRIFLTERPGRIRLIERGR
jgi:glucose/arabinose dehydrogenase